jgi:hypothetical protein
VEPLRSASEIAALKLPGLPGSKVAIAARAEREGWYCEERTGLGGTRRVYRLPARYQDGQPPEPSGEDKRQAPHAAVADGRPRIELDLLQMVETVLDEVLQQHDLKLKPERRGAVVAFLYDYASRGGGKDGMRMALQALVA